MVAKAGSRILSLYIDQMSWNIDYESWPMIPYNVTSNKQMLGAIKYMHQIGYLHR